MKRWRKITLWKKMYVFEVMKYLLKFASRKRWCNVSVTCFLVLLKLSRVQFSSVQSLGHVWLFVIPWTAACQTSLFITISQSVLKLNSQVSDAIQPSHPLSAASPPAFNLSQHQGLFKWVRFSHQMPKDWSFSFCFSPSKEIPGLISFRMDWLDLLAAQETLKNLQHHS